MTPETDPLRLAGRLRALAGAVAAFAPTRRCAVLVLVAAPVWLLSGARTGALAATSVTAFVLLLILGDALFLPDAASLHVAREVPAVIPLGEPAHATYVVESSWIRRATIWLAHAPPDGIAAPLSYAAARVSIAPGERLEIPFQITGLQRGVFPLGRAALVVAGPLGFVRRTLRFSLPDTVMVVPAAAGVHHRLTAAQRLRRTGWRLQRRRGTGTTFAALREYTPGDDPRHIDWKATARHRHLITREYSVERGQTVMIAVDAGRMMTQWAADGRARFEYALTAAMTLAEVALSAGDQVGLIAFDVSVRAYIAPERGPGTLRAIRDALTALTPELVEPDYAAAFRTLAERQRRRSLIVLFTDVIDTRSSQAIIALTARSAERHLALVVALQNDELVSAAIPQAQPADGDVYRTVAAEELVEARAAALARMRLAGVAVLDVPLTALTSALVERYLQIKERSAL